METVQKQNIFIVDDDTEICALLKDFLSQHGYQVSTAHNGTQLKSLLKTSKPDLIILDIMMPGDDGLTICKDLRKQSNVPIIMISAVGDDTDRIVGLEIGADDYLPKPFNPRELLARVKAVLRRSSTIIAPEKTTNSLIYFDDWTIDCQKRSLISPEQLTVPLSAGEYDLLMAFIKHPNQIMNRDQLLDFTSNKKSTAFDRAIDVQVGRLRKKIEKDSKNPEVIKTIRSGGYQFTANVRRTK